MSISHAPATMLLFSFFSLNNQVSVGLNTTLFFPIFVKLTFCAYTAGVRLLTRVKWTQPDTMKRKNTRKGGEQSGVESDTLV